MTGLGVNSEFSSIIKIGVIEGAEAHSIACQLSWINQTNKSTRQTRWDRLGYLIGGDLMERTIKVEIKPEEIIWAVRRMKKRERDAFVEDLLASTSPDYLESIKEARADYRAGRVKRHAKVFGSWVTISFILNGHFVTSTSWSPLSGAVLAGSFCAIKEIPWNTLRE